MAIQQSIAKLEGSCELLERMAIRMDLLARWLRGGGERDRELDDVPPEVSVGELECREPSVLTYKAVMAAGEYLQGLRTDYEELRKKYLAWKNDAAPGRMVSNRIQQDSFKLRAEATFVRYAAAALRSLAAQQHEQRTSVGTGSVVVPTTYWIGVLRDSLNEVRRFDDPHSDVLKAWRRRTEQAIETLFGVGCRASRDVAALLHSLKPPAEPWGHCSERPDWGAIQVLLQDVLAQAEAAVAPPPIADAGPGAAPDPAAP